MDAGLDSGSRAYSIVNFSVNVNHKERKSAPPGLPAADNESWHYHQENPPFVCLGHFAEPLRTFSWRDHPACCALINVRL